MTTILCAAAAAASVAIAGWRWRPGPERCRAFGRPGSPITIDTASAGGSTIPRHRIRLPLRRSPIRGAAEIAEWCDDLSAALRSGRSLAKAIDGIDAPAALAEVVSAVRHDLRRGASLGDSMRATSPDDPDARFTWVIVTAVAEHGGPAAEPIDRAAAALRARHAERVERQTQSTTARLSARVMTALPVAMLLLLLTTSPPVRDATRTPIGTVAVVGGIGLNLAGWWWMRRLLDRAAR